MGWNIEVACIKGIKPSSAVPDVFASTDETVGFEDATSATRGSELCVAKIGAWVVVIDVGCRLSQNTDYLAATSATGELYVVRIATAPLERHYVKGALVSSATGHAPCMKLAPRADCDGELIAIDLLTRRTGLRFQQDLWNAKYTIYALD
ncbi:MAG: hypothetical protein NT062_09770 [Proteobacteria bacterium]|nr:hypothetical protein [Pseudomonadota bacterium]